MGGVDSKGSFCSQKNRGGTVGLRSEVFVLLQVATGFLLLLGSKYFRFNLKKWVVG